MNVMREAKPLSQKSLSLYSNALLPSGILVTMCSVVFLYIYMFLFVFFFCITIHGYENKQTDFEKDFSPVLPLLVS